MVADLLLILRLGVQDDLGQHLGQDVFEELRSKDHLRPVVASLKDVKNIAWERMKHDMSTGPQGECRAGESELTIEVDLVIEERVVEDLHRNLLLAEVLGLELRVLDGDVLLDIAARKLDLLVDTGTVRAHDGPVGGGDGDAEEKDKEDVGLEAAVAKDGEGALDEPGDAKDEGGELGVGEVAIALGETDEGGVLDGWGVGDFDRVGRHDARHGRLGERRGLCRGTGARAEYPLLRAVNVPSQRLFRRPHVTSTSLRRLALCTSIYACSSTPSALQLPALLLSPAR